MDNNSGPRATNTPNLHIVRDDAPPAAPRRRKDKAVRLLSQALEEYVHAVVEEVAARDVWLSQETSPLGVRQHLELARRGVLPSRKVGRRVLVRRSDLESFLQQTELTVATQDDPPPAAPKLTVEELAREMLADLGTRERRP